MIIPKVIGDLTHGMRVKLNLNGCCPVEGAVHLHINNGYTAVYIIHHNPNASGAVPPANPYPFGDGHWFSWYICEYSDSQLPISRYFEDGSNLQVATRNRFSQEKSKVIVNHNALLGILGRVSKSELSSTEAQNAAREIAKQVKQRKDLMIGFSTTEEGKFSYASKTEHRMDTVRRIKTSFGRIVSRQLSAVAPDHVLGEVSGAIMSMSSPYLIEEFRGKRLTDVYAACNRISGLASCMTHSRGQVCLYEENPDNVSIITARTHGGGLIALVARALVFKTDGGKRMISRIYSLGDAPKSALKAWAADTGVADCYNDEGSESLTLKFASNNSMPYMDSFQGYDDDEPTPGHKITFRRSGDYSANSTVGDHAGNNGATCDDCDERMIEDESYYVQCHDRRICQHCYENDYSICESCSEITPNDRYVEVDNNCYCQDCAPEHVTCGICDYNISVNSGDYVCVEDEYYCDRHAPSSEECCKCGDNFKDENITEIDGKQYCPDCVPSYDNCHGCGENFSDTTEVNGKFYCVDCKPEDEEETEEDEEKEMAVA